MARGLTLFALLALAGLTVAQDCRPVVSTNGIQRPVVHAPAQTVHPTPFGHKPAVTTFDGRPVVFGDPTILFQPVPVALFQFISPPTTPPPVAVLPSLLAAPAPAVTSNPASDAEQRLSRIEKALEKLSGGAPQTLTSSAPVAYADGEPVPGKPVQAPPQTAKAPTPVPAQEDGNALVLQASSILSRACSSCHTAPKGRGSVNLFRGDGVLSPDVSWAEVYAAVTKGDGDYTANGPAARERQMPLGPDSVKLSPAEKDVLRRVAALKR